MISLIIPTLRIGNKLEECIDSLKGEYDELVIIDDKIDNLAKKINKGLEQATGDFLIVSNDDITLEWGHLRYLCEEGIVASPAVNKGYLKDFHAHMFCLPRGVYEDVGGYFEGYDGFYYDDSDYWMKLLDKGYTPKIVSRININHNHPGSTLGTFSGNDKRMENNRRIFVERWGEDALKTVGCA